MPELVARTRVSDIRRFWHVVQAPPTLLKRLEPAYYVFITLAIGGPLVYGTVSTALSEVATPHAVGIWGPSIALVALLAVVRWGAVQGPVVFSVADITHLLGAPLRRAELVLGRLIRGLLAWTGAAAVVGGLVLVGVAGDHRGIDAVRAAGFVVASAIFGLLGVVGAALVAGSERVDRATRRAAWPAVVIAGGLVVLADSSTTGRHIALWSGPWGWAVQPLAGTAAAWPVAVVLLAALTAAITTLAVRRRGATPTERHLVRAEARGGAVAAIYSMNARYVRRSLTAVSTGPVAARGANRLKPPRSSRLTIAWRDAVAALAVPQRLAEALVLAAGGTAVCLVNGAHPVAVGAGALAIYAGASRLLEPLRAEVDKPGRVRVLLRAPIGKVLVQHALVPLAVVVVGALLAVAGCAAAGALPDHGGAAVVLAVLATPTITLCAALSSRRGGRLPPSLLAATYGDTSGMSVGLIFGWIILWPLVAAVTCAATIGIVVNDGPSSVPTFVIVLVLLPSVLARGLAAQKFAP
ncbi:hypothetical protein [Solirubrobacter soli]|uniref:hypothetical protein n=1 Tax=Solirubrobacter soli TaxID=363832 RepID=UPI0003FBD73F|nr:hypothetical protein [Solirubrobacter soli]